VTASLADKKKVVRIRIPFSPAEAVKGGTGGVVSAQQLAVPRKAQNKFRDAQNRLSRRDIEGAVRFLEEAVEMAPHFASAWNSLGVIAYQTRDWSKAEQHFRRALEAEPEAFEPTVNLGGVLLSLGKLEEALGYNRKGVEKRPSEALANAQLGMTYFQMGKLDLAEEHLLTAKRADPSHFSQPQLFLAEIYARRGRRDAAIRELEDMLARNPDGPLAERLRQGVRRMQTPAADAEEAGSRAAGQGAILPNNETLR
jgi:tetratricopeptide (TPR) repeat protein